MTTRIESNPEDIDEVIREVGVALRAALQKRVQKHGRGYFVGGMEALGCITEEYHEFIEAVRSDTREQMAGEAMDVAVAALWAHMSLKRNPA